MDKEKANVDEKTDKLLSKVSNNIEIRKEIESKNVEELKFLKNTKK